IPDPINIPFPLFAEINSLWAIIWLCMSLGVMWIGVFTALQSQKVGTSIVNSIKGFGEGIGKVALKLPLSIPFVPAPSSIGIGGANQSASILEMKDFARNLANRRDITDATSAVGSNHHLANTISAQSERVKNDIRTEINVSLQNDPTNTAKIAQIMKRRFQNDQVIQRMDTDSVFDDVSRALPDLKDKLDRAIEQSRNQSNPPSPAPAATEPEAPPLVPAPAPPPSTT
ncbi:MAG: hypothetical protein AAB728_00080, partial [Patescibacteria group bacterium]